MCECGKLNISGRGAAWLARLLGVQEVPGSNPGGPTKYLKDLRAFNEMGRAQSVPIHSAHCTPP